MAVRFNGVSDQRFTSTTSIPASTGSFTWCGWINASATTNGTSWCNYFTLTNSTSEGSGVGIFLRVNTSTRALTAYLENSATITGSAINTGEWWFSAITGNGTTASMYYAISTATTVSKVTATRTTTTPVRYLIGDNQWNEPWNGRIANAILYDVALTDQEIDLQFRSFRPVKPASVNRWHPLISSTITDCTYDFSGNARNFTSEGTPTIQDGPPLSWGSAPLVETGNYKEPYTVSWIELETVKSAIDERVQLYIVN